MNFLMHKTYTFNTLAPAILGASIKNAKLIGILDYDTALSYDNVNLKYRQIFPILPTGTPNQPEKCLYYRFLSESKEKIILADQWIDENSIEVIDHVSFQVNFVDASVEDLSRVRDLLNASGYVNFTMKQL